MREIKDHQTNGTNEKIQVLAIGEPGPGGAAHIYEIHGAGASVRLEFQNGPLAETGPNGITNETLLAVLIDRLSGFQAGPFACPENEKALGSIRSALRVLHKRTAARVARGEEGRNVA